MGKIAGTIALGGFLLGPLWLAAQDIDNRQPPQPAPPRERDTANDTPEALRIQPMLREMEELLRAGKLDEVLERAARIRDIAKDNPRIMNLIERAMGERNPKPDAAQRKPAGPDAAGPPPRVRIQHLREAAEHLNAAGFEKLADQARAEIGRIETDARRQQARREQARREQAGRQQAGREQARREQAGREQAGREQAGREQAGRQQAGREQAGRQQARREQAERQQAASRETGPDANAAIKEEMNQLHQELQDLRNQLRRLKADAAPQHVPLPPKPPLPPNPPMEGPQ